ncbi:hypothetical protein GMOD_00003169 [Pyrenophora seminiperda CCB06]|uniref:Uncharacterized protein n=1 Tax=Pyrenophora seminiperda CCB06 TaxID=1302712 RepID=A0A3M7M429_9PLEO|nr:hypothetical protein GMOD_00003169 [Pyrenophora seminiperda CCB06]
MSQHIKTHNVTMTPEVLSSQPYTAPFLARLSTFILRAPISTVKEAFDLASDARLPSLCKSLDANSDALRPDSHMNMLCQRLVRILHNIPANFPPDQHPSPDTIPMALCMLARYRVAQPSSQREVPSSLQSSTREVPTCPVLTAVSAPIPGALSDVMLVTLAVYTAYKYLAGDHFCVKLRVWAGLLEMNAGRMPGVERMFLAAMDYRVFIGQEEYLERKGRLDRLWQEVFRHVARPPPPAFLLKKLGRLG